MRLELLTWLIPLPPLLAFGLIVLRAHRSNRLSHTLAVGAMVISWALAMVVFALALGREHLGEDPIASAIDWIPTGASSPRIGVLIDPLSAITLFFVAGTCRGIFV